MARGVNKVILIGNLGKDPEVRYTQSNVAVANFSVATSESWTGADGEKKEKTEWHNIVVWKKLAEICAKYLTKGRQVYLEGSIQTRKWEDRDGNTRYTTEIVARNMQMLGSRNDGGEGGGQRGGYDDNVDHDPGFPESDEPGVVSDDDIPFSWLLPIILLGWVL